jgi:hypothetical protein
MSSRLPGPSAYPRPIRINRRSLTLFDDFQIGFFCSVPVLAFRLSLLGAFGN